MTNRIDAIRFVSMTHRSLPLPLKTFRKKKVSLFSAGFHRWLILEIHPRFDVSTNRPYHGTSEIALGCCYSESLSYEFSSSSTSVWRTPQVRIFNLLTREDELIDRANIQSLDHYDSFIVSFLGFPSKLRYRENLSDFVCSRKQYGSNCRKNRVSRSWDKKEI